MHLKRRIVKIGKIELTVLIILINFLSCPLAQRAHFQPVTTHTLAVPGIFVSGHIEGPYVKERSQWV